MPREWDSIKRPPPDAMPTRPTNKKSAPAPVPDILLLASVVPDGSDRFIVTPRQPVAGVEEVGSAKALRVLGLTSRSLLYAARDSAFGARHLRWRFTGPSRRKILWELPSLLEYKEATKLIGK